MTDPKQDGDAASDPSSELGLRNPVRDKARLGDEQYSVTPPRKEVKPARTAKGAHACSECQADLADAPALRADGEEYVYHFCSEACRTRWTSRRAVDTDDPRQPRP